MPTRPVLLAAAFAAVAVSFAAPIVAQQPAPQTAAPRRTITFDDFESVRGVSAPQLSPDGKSILYAVRVADLAANRRSGTTYLIPAAGGTPVPFPAAGINASEASWSPDGRRVAYVAGDQLWVADASGANAVQLTNLNGGATGPMWSPAGDKLAFTSRIYPDCTTDACNRQKDKERSENKVKAHVADQLMYRHWNAWDDGQRSHLFVVSVDGGAARDLIPADNFDTPVGPFGGSEGYAFSPDGQEITFTAKDQGREDAWSTNIDLYRVPVGGGPTRNITASFTGADQNPVYSPDGRYIAYASQMRAGFEADRWRLMLYDRNSRRSFELLSGFDRNADAYMFARDMSAIYVQSADAGRTKLYRSALAPSGSGPLRAGPMTVVVKDHDNTAFTMSRDGSTLAWLRDAAEFPNEVWSAPVSDGPLAAQQVTHENDEMLSKLALSPAEDYWFTGAGGTKVHGFIIKPPNFDSTRKYPAILLVHGGPQSAWSDGWSSRWNYQMFAATGAALVVINPRGSIGYGQKFTDEISHDWGGKVYTDLMNGLDAALKANPWMDKNALGAAGGSYGGYMVNWIAGHTDRFKAIVSHAGVYNLEAMSGATEELWFTDWEFGQYTDPKAMSSQYRKWSPHLFANKFKTPTLVTAGELDYRVPYTEDLSLFTALQRRNVPSRLVLFPDEGHWILKPQNQRLWWSEVQGWLTKYLAESAPKA